MREFKEHKKPSATASDTFFKAKVQPKLQVGQPGDAFEQEADSVANAVVSKSGDNAVQKAGNPEEEKVQKKPIAESISSVQMKELKEEEQPVQKKEEEEQPIQKKEEEEQPVQKKEEEEQPVQKKEEEEQPIQKKEEEEQPVQKKEEEEQPVQKKEEEEQPVQKKEEEEQPVQKKEEEEQPIQKKEEEEQAVQKKEEEEQPIQKKEEEEQSIQNKQGKSTKNMNSEVDIETKLASTKGVGQKLEGAVKNEMESGFGTSFNNVRIHVDSTAEQMTKQMGALAFTHGNDIYFNSGQYNPTTPEGKALIAHELTHTIQQEGADKSENNDNDANLESDAVGSTKGVVGKMLGGIGAFGKTIMPKLKSGLRIAKCDPSARDKALAEFKKKRAAGNATIPAANPSIMQSSVSLGTDSKTMDSYHRFQNKEVAGGNLVWGFFFSKDKSLTSATKKPSKLNTWKDFNALSTTQKLTLFQISRITGEVIHNKYSETNSNLDKLKLAYSYWPSDQYAVHQSGSSEASNTCNVFVGNALYNAGFIGNNKGKLWSANQVYNGAAGNFVEIDKAFTMPGDIVAYGGHVGVVVKVDPSTEVFITREGYQPNKGAERIRSFDELLGIEHPELRVMRKK